MSRPGAGIVLPACLLLATGVGRSTEPEDRAIAAIRSLGGSFQRDQDAPGRPIVSVGLPALDIQGAEFKEIETLKDVRTLRLWGEVTEATLKKVASLSSLVRLEMEHCKITGAALAELKSLKQLGELDVSATEIGNAAVKQLVEGCSKLRCLSLAHTCATDEALTHLAALKDLRALDLTATLVTDEGLQQLGRLPQLESLDLAWTDVTDMGLKKLSGCGQLQSLRLLSLKITDEGMSHLSSLRRLRKLTMTENKRGQVSLIT
jgi:internalin A